MNFRKAIRQMLKGKAVRRPCWATGVAIKLGPDGFQWASNGGGMAVSSYSQRATDWEVLELPNPNTPGTFAWAREEARRGKRVTSGSSSGDIYTNKDTDDCFSFETSSFITKEFDATDWRVVS